MRACLIVPVWPALAGSEAGSGGLMIGPLRPGLRTGDLEAISVMENQTLKALNVSDSQSLRLSLPSFRLTAALELLQSQQSEKFPPAPTAGAPASEGYDPTH